MIRALRQHRLDMVDVLALSFLTAGTVLFTFGVVLDTRMLGSMVQVFIDEWTPGFVIDGALLLVVNRIIRNNAKKATVAQIGSLSNDFALDAVHRAREEGWLQDGTLRQRGLNKAKLRGADLSEADFSGADLRYADLREAQLTHSNLAGANLTGANLADCDLRWANLDEAQLKWAVLSGARCDGANLRNTQLVGAVVDPDCAELGRHPDVIKSGHLTSEQVRALRESFAELERSDHQVIELFYETLFAERPELRSMFSDSQRRQSRKFLQSLKLIVHTLDSPEEHVALLEQLGARHVQYGVQPQHYDLAGRVLLNTLADFFGERFNQQLRNSWQAAFSLIATIMMQATTASQGTRAT